MRLHGWMALGAGLGLVAGLGGQPNAQEAPKPAGKKIIFLSIDDSKEALTHVRKGDFEVNTPYTPLIADIGMRVLLNTVAGEKMPQDIITPNIPMVTPKGEEIFGLKTQTPDQWWEYTFGPPL